MRIGCISRDLLRDMKGGMDEFWQGCSCQDRNLEFFKNEGNSWQLTLAKCTKSYQFLGLHHRIVDTSYKLFSLEQRDIYERVDLQFALAFLPAHELDHKQFHEPVEHISWSMGPELWVLLFSRQFLQFHELWRGGEYDQQIAVVLDGFYLDGRCW